MEIPKRTYQHINVNKQKGIITCMPQQNTLEKSELEMLLEKNAYTDKGLTPEENRKARQLIENPTYADEECWLCGLSESHNPARKSDQAIYDTGLCQGHARYALATRK
jgi:hypothetical protein